MKNVLPVVAVLLAGCTGGKPAPQPTPSPTVHQITSTLVYFVVDVSKGFRLAREPRAVQNVAAQDAVAAMIAGPNDPDYSSHWNANTVVRSIETRGSVVTVDLSGAARIATAGSAEAGLMIQQLVYTLTEVLGHRLKVRLLIDGKPAGELWGAVAWDEPVGRAAADDVRQVVQIDTPGDGATMHSPIRVTGEANAFEANVPWRVLDDDGQVVRTGRTSTAEGFAFSKYAFEIELKPGTYSIEIAEDNPSAGDRQLTRDTRTVTVRCGHNRATSHSSRVRDEVTTPPSCNTKKGRDSVEK